MAKRQARNFGIEFSVNTRDISYDQIKENLEAALETKGEGERNILGPSLLGNNWVIKADNPIRIQSPAIPCVGKQYTRLMRIIDEFRKLCAGNNIIRRGDSLQVYFTIADLTDFQMHNLVRLIWAWEPALIQLQPPSRRTNSFTTNFGPVGRLRNIETNRLDDWNTLRHLLVDRNAVNFSRYDTRRTIGFLYSAGTIRGRKVMNWILILQCLIEITKNMDELCILPDTGTTITPQDLSEFIKQNSVIHPWLENRKPRILAYIQARDEELNGAWAETDIEEEETDIDDEEETRQ